MKEEDIVFELGDYWVSKEPNGYKVWKTGITHSTKVATVGHLGWYGLNLAILHARKRFLTDTKDEKIIDQN